MKRAIYIILLLLYTTLVHAYMYQSNMPTYQPQTKIGYTTNYGNSFQYTEPSNTPKQLSYTAEERMYGITGSYSPTHSQAPRKALGDRASAVYSGTETSDDGTVTVTWSIEGTDILGIGGKYRIYVEGTLVAEGWMWTSTAKNTAQEEAKRLANERAHSVPIGEPTTSLLLLMFAYLSYQQIKKRR